MNAGRADSPQTAVDSANFQPSRPFIPLAALLFASFVACFLLALRTLMLGYGRHLYLVWNLILAWLPLAFALIAGHLYRENRPLNWRFSMLALAWLLFFPNAPYILTDLVHLAPASHTHFWSDLVLTLLFALIGLVLGFLSLYLMHQVAAHRFGRLVSWLLVGAIAGMSGFGIYAGRFFRWNSWDALLNPLTIVADGGQWLGSLPTHPSRIILPTLFATLLFLTYLILYALTHLAPAQTLQKRTTP